MRALMPILTSIALFGFINCATANTAEWKWSRVTPDDQTGWSIEQGSSPMSIEGDRFKISLTKDHASGVDIILEGTIHGTHVSAVETLQGTDASPQTFRGTLTKSRTPVLSAARGWGSNRIWLSTPGGFYVGLFQSMQASSK